MSTTLPLALSLWFITQSACFAQFAIGDRVDASPYGADFYGATVIGTVQGGFTVKMDGGGVFKPGEKYVVPMNRIRANTIAAPAPAPAPVPKTNAQTKSASTTSSGAGDRVHPANSNLKWTTNYTAPGKTGPTNTGKGQPPNGTYHCVMWTAGMMINMGDLEIQGSTYRGLTKTGGFHSFTIDQSGNMNLSAGLNGMPEGFKLKTVGWVGPDSQGRPMIKIGYIGKSNAHDTIDAIKR